MKKIFERFKSLNNIEKVIVIVATIISIIILFYLSKILLNAIENFAKNNDVVFAILFLGILIGTPIIAFYVIRSNRIEKLRIAYKDALNLLKTNPQDSNLRQRALNAGRRYYSLINYNTSSAYNKQAINNDLLAIFGTDKQR
ncbi:MAG: hypothetical protein AAGA80_15645 [Cyanobacteria bacterium P01_F01_bin.143]